MIFKVYNLFIINKVQKTQDPAALRCFLRSAARQRRTICKRENLEGICGMEKDGKANLRYSSLHSRSSSTKARTGIRNASTTVRP